MLIPSVVPEKPTFDFTTFESRHAVGSEKAKASGWGQVKWDYQPPTEQAWGNYVLGLQLYSCKVMSKDKAPGIVHGKTTGWRSNIDTLSVSALVLDCDDGLGPPDLKGFEGVRYALHLRPKAGKWHLTIPLARAWSLVERDGDVAPNQATARRAAFIKRMGEHLGRKLDTSLATVSALLHPYTLRPDETAGTETPIVVVGESEALLEWDQWAEAVGYQDPPPHGAFNASKKRPLTARQAEFANAVESKVTFLDAPPRSAGKCVLCPFDRLHSGFGVTSTVLSDRGTFICLHASCSGRPQADFYAELGIPVSDYCLSIEEALAARVPQERVSVGTAATEIRAVLAAAEPFSASASAVRVTTGAGKTAAVTDFLDDYSAPRFDSETGDVLPGKSAVLAVPTNALLAEVSKRLNVPHRIAQGVLAVLNDDGTPACKKFDAAKRLQGAGGDVHRLMCSKCEWKEGCPARAGSRRGEGALTLTNHALLPSLVSEAHEGGKIPLVVWDESPQWVYTTVLPFKEVQWLVDRFDYESKRPMSLEYYDDPNVFSERYRIATRPLVEVLRLLKGAGSLAEAAAEYGRLRVSATQLERAEAFLGLPVTGAGAPARGDWLGRVRLAASAAERVNAAETVFDALPVKTQAAVLRAEAVGAAVAALLEPGTTVEPTFGGLRITGLTPSGRLWRSSGGVVLDATASIASLTALRPDVTVKDLAVRDAPGVTRYLKVQRSLSRKGLASALAEPGREATAIRDVRRDVERELSRLRRSGGPAPKAVLFSYRAFLEAFAVPGVELRHYGNVRGYDQYFQEGYNVFITVGDPYPNISEVEAVARVLGVEAEALADEAAEAELGQAHGRARDPQRLRTGDGTGARTHLHYGILTPAGWDKENATLDLSYGKGLIAGEGGAGEE